MRNQRLNSLLLVAVALAASPAHAYIGPGAGAGAIAVVLGILAAVAMAFAAVLWYPLKRLLKKRSGRAKKPAGRASADDEKPDPS